MTLLSFIQTSALPTILILNLPKSVATCALEDITIIVAAGLYS